MITKDTFGMVELRDSRPADKRLVERFWSISI